MQPQASEQEDGDTPGNKVVYAVSRSYGNCVHCAMLFPERMQRTVKRARVTGSDSAVASDVEMADNEPSNEISISSPGFVPDGVYREGERTWYHVPNFGRKFFDALRKYYVIREDGSENRVLIKRPEKDSYCTWIGIQGNPRNYSTGGKRSASSAGAAKHTASISPPSEETVGNRGRLISVSTAVSAELSPPAVEPEHRPPPISTEFGNPKSDRRMNSPHVSENYEFFGNFYCDESPNEILRNKNACLKLNALPDWFP